MAVQNGTFRRVWSQRGRRRGEGERGKDRALVPGNVRPSWLAGDRAGDCAGRCLPRSAMWLRLAGAGHFLSSWGQFSLPREMGREARQACGGSRRTPSFPEASTVCVLTGNPLYRLKRRESPRRAVHSHNPIPSEMHAFGVSCFLFLCDPYISGVCCHQTGMNQRHPPLGVA